MNTLHKRFGIVAAFVVCAVLVIGLLVHAAHLASRTTAIQFRARVEQKVARKLISSIRDQRLAPESKVAPVAVTAAATLADLEKASAYHGVVVQQIELRGARGTSSAGLQNLASAARPSGHDGLRRVRVILTGSWSTLPGLEGFIDTLHRQPARIRGIDIGPRYLRMSLTIYGR